MILVNRVMFSPFRGSEYFINTVTFRSGDVQVSVVETIGRSLPSTPYGNRYRDATPFDGNAFHGLRAERFNGPLDPVYLRAVST